MPWIDCLASCLFGWLRGQPNCRDEVATEAPADAEEHVMETLSRPRLTSAASYYSDMAMGVQPTPHHANPLNPDQPPLQGSGEFALASLSEASCYSDMTMGVQPAPYLQVAHHANPLNLDRPPEQGSGVFALASPSEASSDGDVHAAPSPAPSLPALDDDDYLVLYQSPLQSPWEFQPDSLVDIPLRPHMDTPPAADDPICDGSSPKSPPPPLRYDPSLDVDEARRAAHAARAAQAARAPDAWVVPQVQRAAEDWFVTAAWFVAKIVRALDGSSRGRSSPKFPSASRPDFLLCVDIKAQRAADAMAAVLDPANDEEMNSSTGGLNSSDSSAKASPQPSPEPSPELSPESSSDSSSEPSQPSGARSTRMVSDPKPPLSSPSDSSPKDEDVTPSA